MFIQQHDALTHAHFTQSLGPAAAGQAATGILYGNMLKQAQLAAYIDNFRLLAIMCVCCLPFLFLFKKTAKPKGPVSVH